MTNTEYSEPTFRYTTLDGMTAYGVVWSPGPLRNTVWVLAESGASTAVVVRVPVKPGETYRQIEWDLNEYVTKRHGSYATCTPALAAMSLQLTRIYMAGAPKMAPKTWRAALAHAEQLELIAA